MNLLSNAKITYGRALVAAANNTSVATAVVDMTGWDGVMCILPMYDSANAGVATLTGRSASTNVAGAALAGAVATATDAGGDALNSKCLIVDIYKPRERYVDFLIASSAANVAFDAAIIIQYKGRKAPVTQSTTHVAASTSVISPAKA
jgi:hypothetical protein